MNKKTVAMSEDSYKSVVTNVLSGFSYTGTDGKQHKFRPNRQLALAIQTEATTGMRIGDCLRLHISDIVKDGNRWRLNVTEQKTGKSRTFTIPRELYLTLKEYALGEGRLDTDTIFTIGERAVQKQLAIVSEHLGLDNISTHSARKTFAQRVYTQSGYNVELVRQMLQHSNIATTQRYLGQSNKAIEDALEDVTTTFLVGV